VPKTEPFNKISESIKTLAKNVSQQRNALANKFQENQQANEDNLKEIAERQKNFEKALEKFDEISSKVGADSEILTVAEARKVMNKAEDGLPFIKARSNYKQAVTNEKQDKDMLAFVDSSILPVIDELLDANKDRAGIPIKEIEKGVKKILNALYKKGLINIEDELVYLHKDLENGKTAFMQDLQTSLNIQDKSQTIKSINLQSSKDKFLHFVSKMCTSLGNPQLVKHCRKHMSKEAQLQFKSSELDLKSLVLKTLGNLNKPKQSKSIEKLQKQTEHRLSSRSNGPSR